MINKGLCICTHELHMHTGQGGSLGCTMCKCLAYAIDVPARKKYLEEQEALLKLKLQGMPDETIVCYYCKKVYSIKDRQALKDHLIELHKDQFLETVFNQCEQPDFYQYRTTRDELHYIAEELYYVNRKLKAAEEIKAQ